MKEKDAYLDYLKEVKRNRRITRVRKVVGYSFLAIFLYFLFSVSYTASPAIVILNYLALLTSVSGLVFLKMFEIPTCILTIKDKLDGAEIFQLTEVHRAHIFETTARGMNLHSVERDYTKCTAREIIELFRLDGRLPWRKIGILYLILYLSTVLFFCTYLILDYMETGFLRP